LANIKLFLDMSKNKLKIYIVSLNTNILNDANESKRKI